LRDPSAARIAQGIKKSSPYVKKQNGGTTSRIDPINKNKYIKYGYSFAVVRRTEYIVEIVSCIDALYKKFAK
jgi:hypothetical protein